MASLGSWLATNWFSIVQSGGIILGLLFAGLGFWSDVRSRRISSLLALKAEHREIWNIVHEKKELARILQPEVDLVANPMTNGEEIFLRQVIVHFAVAWELIQEGTPVEVGAFAKDAAHVFKLPLPRLAWERAIHAQNPNFARFINEAIGQDNG